MLKACIDTNVWISGILFRGAPADVVSAAFARRFEVILSQVIVEEIERNLLGKFGFGKKNTSRFIYRILDISDLYEPVGKSRAIPHHPSDSLVLETARIGKARYLVTGDKQHLLPLKSYRMVRIIEPAHFLTLLKMT